MAGKVEASIENIVNDLQEIKWEQVIFEAVTNSLQANAININIKFYSNSLEVTEKKYIDQIIIEDDGEGFTEKNIESFKNYRSPLKRDLGCKGIGRFLYLKIFEKIQIKSLDKCLDFVIDKDIKVSNLETKIETTKVYFNVPKKKFYVNYEKLEQDLKDHFIAYFKLKENENKKININIFKDDNSERIIKSTDIPKFETVKFKINTHEFILDYVVNDKNIKDYDGFYCANNRVVIKNSYLESKKKFNFFKNINILFLLSSKYFDNNVNETRDDLTIMPKRTINNDLFGNISWEDIHYQLAIQFKEIAKKKNIDIDGEAKKSLNKARKKAPFLAFYLMDNENGLDEEDLLKQAKKEFEDDKEKLRNNCSDDFDKLLGIVNQAELAEYIFDRQKKIEQLKTLATDEALEKEIHNLFMKQKTQDEIRNYKSNNLWLFDDRFMAYDKIFSDKQIKKIFPKLSQNIERPDILSIVSNTYEKEYITDIVIIELKKPDDKITPARAEEQLIDYASYVNSSRQENKIRVWTYAFLKFNEEIENKLKRKSYNQIPTHSQYPIYYRYWEEPNTIINFIDYKSLAFDADTRNKTFMKILNGNI
ncbi:ATP-binding protein [Aliarcobacter butzleri]|uniref:ATP-binding protein n=1 Tax=Aliarcobacter butzleri TaxID=28197 RepID=UPI001EDB8E29|nr:ATP-binding protein [Aliarcobacter butzleri]MCG3655570.1 ATP-binding protein [Aliarcobacter butzleri]MDK2050230.1 ATP-binding protein [Aliarcobacter butzleri]